jgi:hypothetical protein
MIVKAYSHLGILKPRAEIGHFGAGKGGPGLRGAKGARGPHDGGVDVDARLHGYTRRFFNIVKVGPVGGIMGT